VTHFLLDTNILSDLVRNPAGNVARKIAEVGEEKVCTSVIVAAELRYGALKRGSARLSDQVEKILSALDILSFEEPSDTTYASIRADLEREGQLIGANDLFIAAHALSLGKIVVTNNEKEFTRVAGLKIENWLRDG
jgi:tRNA(fMet)-specific endonuclease VapC